ncbi:NADH dehydrogenase [ubiquinone] 1 alpha subcomplex subunit 8 [Cotesia glomerata]|uniref:NADH dehydrogenase [ubiquinone] 1 alpha subcomplex subunit 8 n=1 Tax=Cotesia glomerata TaxID=32391 RepID=A0AAV7I9F7_COTGL|nr:NADH dehydrogenase [ubiquinone] 1 alpha subcomplex subunit 8 [Cotesia glomerata]KAH0547355.1 hypothetical protein KQX54_018857 [Cotesia glomerata]
MVVTEKTPLPTEEELTVPEINLSWPVLHAASFYLGKYCENQNNEFMLCRNELDEIKCVNEGKAVTACAFEFLRKLKKHCYQEFDQYYNCVYKSSRNSSFMPCRNTQEALDKCVLKHMNLERPPYGYFCEVKIHDTKRPKPVEELPVYEPIQSLPEDAPKPPAKFGPRWML